MEYNKRTMDTNKDSFHCPLSGGSRLHLDVIFSFSRQEEELDTGNCTLLCDHTYCYYLSTHMIL